MQSISTFYSKFHFSMKHQSLEIKLGRFDKRYNAYVLFILMIIQYKLYQSLVNIGYILILQLSVMFP